MPFAPSHESPKGAQGLVYCDELRSYGPNLSQATNIVVGIVTSENAEAEPLATAKWIAD